MRKCVCLVLLACLCLTLVSCKKKKDDPPPPPPPAVTVTGTWDVDVYDVDDIYMFTVVANFVMQENGIVTGDIEGDPITGSVSGYNLYIRMDDIDGSVVLYGTVNEAGDFAEGVWSDSWGESGTWDATLR